MSQQGALILGDERNAGREDAMSTSGESVNQHLARHPSGEGLGGGLLPQDQGLPVASNQWLVWHKSPQITDSVPDQRALVGPMVADCEIAQNLGSLGGLQGPPLADSGRVQDPLASSSMAAAASAVTQAALSAAHQSALAGHQAQHASQQSEAAGQQAQQAIQVGASALHHTQALRDETSQALDQVKTGLETLHERQGAALSVAQHSDARSSEAVRVVEELRQARLEDQQNFTNRMAEMERVLKQQMEVAESALKSIDALRLKLDSSQAESRTLRQKLTESNWKLSSLSEQQTRNQQAQAQSAAQAAEREKLMMKRAEEIADEKFNQMQQNQAVNPLPPPRQPSPSIQPVGLQCQQ